MENAGKYSEHRNESTKNQPGVFLHDQFTFHDGREAPGLRISWKKLPVFGYVTVFGCYAAWTGLGNDEKTGKYMTGKTRLKDDKTPILSDAIVPSM